MKINHIIKEFVAPQATAQDPGLEREKDVDVIIFGRMPQDFTFRSLIQALEAVLPREYPPGTSQNTQGVPSGPAELIGQQIAKDGGAVVTTKPLSIAQKVVKEFQARGIKCRIVQSGLDEGVRDLGYDAQSLIMKLRRDVEEKRLQPTRDAVLMAARELAGDMEFAPELLVQQVLGSGVAEGTAGLPDPNNFDSDNDYYDARDAYATPQDNDSDYENWAVDDANESKEKVGNMDADAFDAALSRMKKLAGAGPLRTVYDPNKRVYKNVPHAVQPAQQPKKAR
jgi:hypothetical protein